MYPASRRQKLPPALLIFMFRALLSIEILKLAPNYLTTNRIFE